MTDYTWVGGVSTASSTAANWSPAAVPTASDNVIFDNSTATADCVWTLGQITNITHDMTGHTLIFDSPNLEVLGVFHFDGAVEVTAASLLVKFTGSGETLITFDDETSWVNGDTDKAKTTFEILGTGTNIMFQNGEYPIVKIGTSTTVSPHVPSAPNNTYTETDFYQLTFAATGKFAETSALVYSSDPKLERSKVFRIRSVGTWSVERFEGGKAIWIFYATTAGFELPLSGSNLSTATSFESKVAQIKVVATTIGQKIKVPPGPHYLEKLTIDAGVMCLCDRSIAELHMTNRPIIDGAWQFVQITDGIYRSAKEDMILPITHGGTGQRNAQDAINALSQVSAATNEHVLTKDTTTGDAIWKAAAGGGGGASNLDDLGDVDVSSAVETQILRHDGTSFVNEYNDIFFLRVKAREAINKGEAVYIFDAHNSNVVGVKKAKADSASTMPCIGVAYETLALGDEGVIVAFGKANGIAANFTEGETMYVSPTTAGALTNTKPTANTHLIQNVGILMQAHASNAVVKITGVGRSNDVPNQFSIGGSITAGSFVKSGGASSEFLKADGSVDANTYSTATGVEDNADVTDAANVQAAGALMDSEVANLQEVKDFDPADYATAAQGALADTAVQTETDPVFSAHPAAGVVNAGGGDISLGETAFTWGDHAGLYATATQGATADAALPTTGGTMTGEIEATTITLNAIPADPATDTKVRLGESDGGGSNNMLRIKTDAGYIDIGPNNSGYAHLLSDRNQFYFNKPITYNGNKIYAYSGGMQLGTGSTAASGTTAITIAHASTDITVAGTTTSTGFIKTGGTSSEFLMADGSVSGGSITGQYQKFVLDSSITSLTNGSTEQLSFGAFGGSGSALLYEQYDPAGITDFSFDPLNPDYLTINADGLYQFTFAGFLAGISGGSTIDYRLTISSTPSLTGDILSFRNRTSTVDRYSGSGVSTVYLTTGSQVFFSAFCAGRTWEIGGIVLPSETRTFIDVRRLE